VSLNIYEHSHHYVVVIVVITAIIVPLFSVEYLA